MNQKSFSALVMDDDANDVFLLRRALRKAESGLSIIAEVYTGEDAIDYLSGTGIFSDRAKHPFPDVLILDLGMRGKDGFQILEWLQGRKEIAVKVLVLTSSLLNSDRERAFKLGALHYHRKPMGEVTWAKLVRALENDLLQTKPHF